jgi:putative hydrolase of the HAD superfamily
MADVLALDVPDFVQRYWQHRHAYDAGCPAAEFWSAVAARPLEDPALLEELVRLDMLSWGHLNQETLDALDAVQRRGAPLSLLSNAPHELARALQGHPAFANFDQLMFSAQLGATKPDRAIFEAAIERLGRPAEEVLFIDDRAENVEGAREAGLQAVQFTSAAKLREILED